MEAAIAQTDNGHAERFRIYSAGQPWVTVQEGMLQAIIARANLPKRTTLTHWQKIADDLSHACEPLGLPLRSPSSCWRKAARMGLIASKPETKSEVVEVVRQATFAAPEIRGIIADAFEEIAKRLRGVA